MTFDDWINIARCNQRRMMQDLTYTFFNTRLHDRWREVYSTTGAALKLAVKASQQT
jgi:hypothetical protein